MLLCRSIVSLSRVPRSSPFLVCPNRECQLYGSPLAATTLTQMLFLYSLFLCRVEFGVMHEFCYRLENGGELVVSTTRPETIPGDVALAVHPDDSRYRVLPTQLELDILTSKMIGLTAHPRRSCVASAFRRAIADRARLEVGRSRVRQRRCKSNAGTRCR